MSYNCFNINSVETEEQEMSNILLDSNKADEQSIHVLHIMSERGFWQRAAEICMIPPKVARWENCREQGYVVCVKSPKATKQINIAFFEHRNSDEIHAVKWEQLSTNSLTIETAIFGDIYKDKWDTSHKVPKGCARSMSIWIVSELSKWLEDNKNV